MKDIKGSCPVQLAEYATERRIAGEPVFAWWICNVLQKRNRIIAKLKTKYWVRTHKFGVKIPKTIKEAKLFDEENGNTLWWDAICNFEVWDKDVLELPPRYQKITCCWTNIVSTLLLLAIRSLNALLAHSIAVNTSYRSSLGITNPGIQALIALDLVIWRK
jgi:hypothetical protein